MTTSRESGGEHVVQPPLPPGHHHKRSRRESRRALLRARSVQAQAGRRLGGHPRRARGALRCGRLRHRLDARKRGVHRTRHHVDDPDRGSRDRSRLRARASGRARASEPQRDRGRPHELLHVILSRHAADRPAVPDLPRAPADRDRARRPVGGPPHARRHHGGRDCPGPELRRLHDGDLPGGHPVGGARSVGGRRCDRHDVLPEDAEGRAARRLCASSSRRRATSSSP